ncbi:MAG: hypothetical protein LUD14_03330 [Clostridiales bacterium]|nr:hypothetical protein [Clostridiales bacterium]
MKFKCVNDLDKFDFNEAEITTLKTDGDALLLETSSGIAKYNNPCNTKYVDCYIADTQIRMKNARITRFFLEGPKYYNADDVLLEAVPDKDVLEEDYEKTMKMLVSGAIYVFRETGNPSEDVRTCEIAIDVEDDTYWIEAECERIILEWDRFRNQVEE